MLQYNESFNWQQLWQDSYLQHILLFSSGQALLSSLLSVCLGLILARTLFYLHFPAKFFLLKLLSLTFVLPSLLAIFGILGVYGQTGWLAQLCTWLKIDWQPHIYGLSGILIAHLFFNIPLACRLFLQSLNSIPSEQHQLAAQLSIRGWQFIRLVEWNALRPQILPTMLLIFILCFTSFAIVLTLGGSPKFSTLEVAIYQALLFDFDLAKAAVYALLQLLCCFILFALYSGFNQNSPIFLNQRQIWYTAPKTAVKIWHVFWLSLFILFISLPLLNIITNAFSSTAHLFNELTNRQLWRSIGYSVSIAPLSALLSLSLVSAMLLFTRQLEWQSRPKLAQFFVNSSLLILAIPMLIVAVGLYLIVAQHQFAHWQLFAIVVVCNALSALPFVLKIINQPMHQNMQYYEKLCQSLGIKGWQRFRLIEWQSLAPSFKYAFALACALSLGDFTAIALFGGQDFTSLPYLLYQQLGSYHSEQASITALVLLIIFLAIFLLIETAHHENNDDPIKKRNF